MLEQITEMMNLQEELEIRIAGPDWRDLGHNYPLCIYMECNEIIDHVGWKHWKAHGEPDYDAITMEIVDIWHFMLAHWLQHDVPAMAIVANIQHAKEELAGITEIDMVDVSIGLAICIVSKQQIAIGNFLLMCDWNNLSFDELHSYYVGKNVLNTFRQDYGYATGEYLKNWAGKEDNEHLFELTRHLRANGKFNAVELRKALTYRYRLTGRIN